MALAERVDDERTRAIADTRARGRTSGAADDVVPLRDGVSISVKRG